MPIKLPKTFQRRKSSGSALEEVPNPPQQSFRVLERNPDGSKSFEEVGLFKRSVEVRPLSEGNALDFGQGRARPNAVQLNRQVHWPFKGRRGGLMGRSDSGGTQTSNSSGGPDTSGSSARYSSSSTVPSSASLEHDATPHAKPRLKSAVTMPTPQPPPTAAGVLQRAGRAFSFGKSKTPTPQQPIDIPPVPRPDANYDDIPDIRTATRPRAMTENTDQSYASASTATPPKILDTDLDLSFSGEKDGFTSMFDSISGRRKSPGLPEDPALTPNPLRVSPGAKPPRTAPAGPTPHLFDSPDYAEDTPPPPPLHLDRSRMVSPGLESAKSHSSRDALISSPEPEKRTRESPLSRSTARPRSRTFGVSPTPGSAAARVSRHIQDDDAALYMSFMGSGKISPVADKASRPVNSSQDHEPGARRPVTLYDGENQDHRQISGSRTAAAEPLSGKSASKEADFFGSSPVDDDFRAMAMSADQFSSGIKKKDRLPPAPPSGAGRVMTRAQFDAYRQAEERRRADSDASPSDASEDGSDADNYEDDEDDEAERNRELARQRRRQEAQMSVYRQQMMKVTGEAPPPAGQPAGAADASDRRLSIAASMSAPNLPHLGSLDFEDPNQPPQSAPSAADKGKAPATGVAEEDDEDEDIPLGILAAHGFPSAQRPPSHLTRPGGQPAIRYQSEPYPAPPASVAGGGSGGSPANGGNRGSVLPPFARKLPQYPYYGASLVTPANRESLAFGQGRPESVYGGSQAAGAGGRPASIAGGVVPANAGVPPHLANGGLIGVIAHEERARAQRRGSPNSAAVHDNSAGGGTLGANGMPLPLSLAQLNGQAPLPGAPPQSGPLSPEAQAQLQVNQQMTQMMQLQMQWMAQVMAMQGQPLPPMPPGMGALPPQMPGMPPQMPGMPPMPGMPAGLAVPPQPQQQASLRPAPLAAQGRAMSMLTPGHRASFAPSLGGGIGGGPRASVYAPSIAPSERSTVGQPARYRPVSVAPGGGDDRLSVAGGGRASTMGDSALRAWESVGQQSQSQGLSAGQGSGPGQARTGPLGHGGAARPAGSRTSVVLEEDEDEEGWAEMRKQRESKRRFWRGKRRDKEAPGAAAPESGLEGVFYPVD